MPSSLPADLWELESARVEKLVAAAVAREGPDKSSLEEHLAQAKAKGAASL